MPECHDPAVDLTRAVRQLVTPLKHRSSLCTASAACRPEPRPAGALASKYLLTGMVECGVCGGTIVQTLNANKPAYRCWYNHSRGCAVCSNSLVVDMHLADDTVLQAVTRDVLDPDVVAEALDLALRELEQPVTAVAARPGYPKERDLPPRG